jgi:hypothetical protein
VKQSGKQENKTDFYASLTDLPAFLLIYSIEQSSSWEAKRFADSQEIHHILRNPNVHYCITSTRHLSITWASSNPLHAPNTTSWRSIIILYSRLRLGLPSGLFLSSFPTKTLYTPLLSPSYSSLTSKIAFSDYKINTMHFVTVFAKSNFVSPIEIQYLL